MGDIPCCVCFCRQSQDSYSVFVASKGRKWSTKKEVNGLVDSWIGMLTLLSDAIINSKPLVHTDLECFIIYLPKFFRCEAQIGHALQALPFAVVEIEFKPLPAVVSMVRDILILFFQFCQTLIRVYLHQPVCEICLNQDASIYCPADKYVLHTDTRTHFRWYKDWLAILPSMIIATARSLTS